MLDQFNLDEIAEQAADLVEQMGLMPMITAVLRSQVFHHHLDRCEQCAQVPFKLCPEGHRLLIAAVRPQEERDA